jgi:hypothetical protein
MYLCLKFFILFFPQCWGSNPGHARQMLYSLGFLFSFWLVTPIMPSTEKLVAVTGGSEEQEKGVSLRCQLVVLALWSPDGSTHLATEASCTQEGPSG